MEREENFISGIHNYCDRWCERCPFTARCRVAEAEQETTDEERDITNEAFWHRLAANFAAAQIMLLEKAEEFGVDLNAISEEEYASHRDREDEIVKNDALTRFAEKYRQDAQKTLEAKNEWLIFSALDETAQEEMLSIIYWYQFFISAKIQRGLSGILDFDGNLDEEQLNDAQADANGSIKIALIAVTRSLMAWTALMTNENSQTISPFISLLEIIKQTAAKKFPNAKNFIRPGFDEIEFVM